MHPLIARHRALILAFAILVAGGEHAVACGNGKLLFEDKFQALDPAWGFVENAPNRSAGPEGLVYKLDPGNEVARLNQSNLYDNYEVCVVFATEVPAKADAWVGVAFWGTDMKNAYVTDIYPSWGTYTSYRFQNGKLLTPIPPTANDSIHKGTNATNEISVTVNADKATIAINGKKVTDFNGRPPEGGSLFGFDVGTGKTDTGPSTVRLKSLQLREVESSSQPSQASQPPSAPPQQLVTSGQPQPGTEIPQPQVITHRQTGGSAADCGKGKLILEDKFESLDTVWGFNKQDNARTNGQNGLTYKLTPDDKARTFLNQADFYSDYEVCAVFTTQVASSAASAMASIIFWGQDSDNLYSVDLFPVEGGYEISRTKGGKNLYPVQPIENSSVVKGMNATNQVSVTVNGKNATVSINGEKVIDNFVGTPPERGSLFGFQMAAAFQTAADANANVTLKTIQLREVTTAPQPSQASQQPSATVQPPATLSGQPPGPATPQPSPSSAPSEAAIKPMPSLEGATVALGDPRDSVRQAYPAAVETGAGDLAIPSDGIKFFFTKDGKVLREIMVEAPFKGSIEGIKIGDGVDDVVARRGQPYTIAEVYGGSGYLYRAGGNILRYDVDEKSKKVTDIVQIMDRK